MQKHIQIEGNRGKLNCLLFEPEQAKTAGNISEAGSDTCSDCHELNGAVLFLPGMPGTDQNEDIAGDLCRMNFRVLCLSYSGSCGSEGDYSIAHMLEDSETAFQFLAAAERKAGSVPSGSVPAAPDTAGSCSPGLSRLLSGRLKEGSGISILGHSMGGFVCAQLAASHPRETHAAIMMFPCDIGRLPVWEREAFMTSEVVKDFFYTHASALRGTSSDKLLNEVFANADAYSLVRLAPVLSQIPLLMIGGTKDYYAPPSLNCRPLMDAVHSAGGKNLLYQEYSTGHYGDGSRNMISRIISTFLSENLRDMNNHS